MLSMYTCLWLVFISPQCSRRPRMQTLWLLSHSLCPAVFIWCQLIAAHCRFVKDYTGNAWVEDTWKENHSSVQFSSVQFIYWKQAPVGLYFQIQCGWLLQSICWFCWFQLDSWWFTAIENMIIPVSLRSQKMNICNHSQWKHSIVYFEIGRSGSQLSIWNHISFAISQPLCMMHMESIYYLIYFIKISHVSCI